MKRAPWSPWIWIYCIALGILATGGGCTPSTPTTSTSTPSPTPVPTEMGVTVRLVQLKGCDPEKPELKASTDVNHIRWSNETTADRKVHFTADWPFMETNGDITVAAGAKSAWFTLDPAKVSGGGKPFPYQVTPTLAKDPGEGPDEPSISGQP